MQEGEGGSQICESGVIEPVVLQPSGEEVFWDKKKKLVVDFVPPNLLYINLLIEENKHTRTDMTCSRSFFIYIYTKTVKKKPPSPSKSTILRFAANALFFSPMTIARFIHLFFCSKIFYEYVEIEKFIAGADFDMAVMSQIFQY